MLKIDTSVSVRLAVLCHTRLGNRDTVLTSFSVRTETPSNMTVPVKKSMVDCIGLKMTAEQRKCSLRDGLTSEK